MKPQALPRQRRLLSVLVAFATVLPPLATAWAGDIRDDIRNGEKLFALRVQPIFDAKCNGCHANDPESIQGGFDLRGRHGMLAGGESYGEDVIVVGDAAASELMPLIRREIGGMEMPPKQSEALTTDEIAAISRWIDAGADWPDDDRVAMIYARHAEGVTVATSGGLDDSWTHRKYDPADLWAFQPIAETIDDRVQDRIGDGERPVDAFINDSLDRRGIVAAGPADRPTLVRRLTFDLTGLPPTPAEVAGFVDDPADDDTAWATLVERLLASPHYGEQAARRWLDVARYADSSGFANDWERPNAWRYRDYVIRAFNEDKPFDQFIREQLAGDELIQQATADGVPLDETTEAEWRIAAGFLRMGPWEQTSMSVAKVTRQLFLDDITDTVGQVFLAQPLQCCRCHDHKFDPIPTRDFYSIQAVFATTQFAEFDTCWLPSENRSDLQADRRIDEQRREANEKILQQLDRDKNKSDRTPNLFGIDRIARKWKKRFEWELDRYEPIAYSVYSGKTISRNNVDSRLHAPANPMGKGELEQTTILGGGDPFSPTTPVQPGVLSAVPGALDVRLPVTATGRRLALARWIADPENSLTARVIANRIWLQHFGRGIAGNPNNFGVTGKKPTHPALLDWLAREFVRGGWSVKHLHRVIVSSAAYRRHAQHPETESLRRLDPASDSYAVFRPRRLEAEEIRDAMLAVSGEWNPAMGGIPVRPDMNLEAALQPRMIMGTFAPSYVPHPKPDQRNRRSIYVHKIRGQALPFMETFNQPGSDVSCELRDQSNITPQVFALLNGQESHDRAVALAARVMSETTERPDAIARMIRLAWGRDASAGEIDAAIQHWDAMCRVHENTKLAPATYPTEVTRRAIDENTGEPFEFSETLFAIRDYQPDLTAADVDLSTRALADVALVIFNSNEFVYVY